MRLRSGSAGLVGAAVLGALLWGCSDAAASGREPDGGDVADSLRGTIKIDGSSTVYPITEAVAEEFRKVAPRVRVTLGSSGTGGGFKRFTVGETDVSNASRPITGDEIAIAARNGVDFIELPVAYDGLSIVVNPDNDWCDVLTIADLEKIFRASNQATVKTWRDVRPEWPAVPLHITIPGTDSGTFDYFREIVASKAEDAGIRADTTQSEDDNAIVLGVAGNRGGIGFFGCAYYFANRDKVKAVAIDAGRGPVKPGRETIEDGSYAPFSRPLFIYVAASSADKPAVRAFVDFYLDAGPELAASETVGYVKLPPEIYTLARQNFAARRLGTQWSDGQGGHRHAPVTEIYR